MVQTLLKQAFSPALRLWFLKSCLTSSEEVKRFQPLLQELLGETELEDAQDFVLALSQVLAHWVLTAQWIPFVQTFEMMIQFLQRDDKSKLLDTLQEQWPRELTLSDQGFLYYQEKPVLKYLSEHRVISPGSEAEGVLPEVSLPEVSRKAAFQKIRQHRLRLLKNWESI